MPETADTLTPEQLAAFRAALAAATPGPWAAARDQLGHWRVVWPRSERSSVLRGDKVFSDDDIEFIVLARNLVGALLARVASLEAQVAALIGLDAAAVDSLLERWDRTAPEIQRGTVAKAFGMVRERQETVERLEAQRDRWREVIRGALTQVALGLTSTVILNLERLLGE